jgi:hypothetical protein
MRKPKTERLSVYFEEVQDLCYSGLKIPFHHKRILPMITDSTGKAEFGETC